MFKPHDHWFLGPPPDDSHVSMRLKSWRGGECPVDAEAKVYALLRSGDFYMDPQVAGSLGWSHMPWWFAWLDPYRRSMEIIGYRLAKPTDLYDGYRSATSRTAIPA
jgi:hypothetical protein